MTNQAQSAVEYDSGAGTAPAVVFGPAKAGRKVDSMDVNAVWADAACRGLHHHSGSIRLGDTGGTD